jgi:dolichol-phosphate mannosyltransferase
MNLCLIIPTYNEAKNIPSILTRVREEFPDAHIFVVDDNSPDGTAEVVRTLRASDSNIFLLERAGKEGLGRAYMHGFREALQDPTITHIGMMDADHSHDPMHLKSMQEAATNAEFVIGSRYVAGGKTEGWEPWRMLLSGFGNKYCRSITRMPVNDATAGFNLIDAKLLRSSDLSALDSSGYAFQMELKYLLWLNGARFAEVPIIFRNRKEGESKLSNHIIAEGILAPWKMIFKHRP